MERAAEVFRAQDAVRELDTLAVLGRARRRLAAGRCLADVTSAPERPAAADGGDFVSQILSELEQGSSARRYTPEGEIDRGGQGAVLSVWDETLRRHLAMKVTLASADRRAPGTPQALSLGRFLEEAQVTAQLDHPGIVPVHDLGLDPERRVFFTMKLVKGRDLRAIFELASRGEEKWNRTRALGVLLKVCEAMEYAHSKGVIHRDLKPSNVMVGRYGEVYVMDWGLARVLGTDDRKDIRIRPERASTIQSARHSAADASDSPLVTMDGDVVGTPAYMPPEQARGDIAAMGPHSDVYAIGAMLYQLLSGEMPYVARDARLSNRAVWALVQQGPPTPVHTLAPDVPAELQAICEKAMAREPRARYTDTSQLAEDLRAYLEHRVVSAYETGAIAELRKWVGRNRGLAAALAASILVALVGFAGVGYVQAKGKKAAAAERDNTRRQHENVLRLSAIQELEDLQKEADRLWPAWPVHREAYAGWLSKARDLLAGLEGHRKLLTELEARALPRTEAEREADRRSHPRFPELARMAARMQYLETTQAVREGKNRVEEIRIRPALDSLQANELNNGAWGMVNPDDGADALLGLSLARAASSFEAEDPDLRANLLDTLAWALVANGLDEEAVKASQSALEAATAERKEEFRGYLERIRAAIDAARSGLARNTMEAELAALESDLDRRSTWRFQREEDLWWHSQLRKLVEGLRELADPGRGLVEGIDPERGWGITKRLEWAETIEERTVTGAEASRRWSEALASIADPVECPAYRGLVLAPQLGLLPVGRDPASGLWEFAELQSGEPAQRDADGKLLVEVDSGLVFVLLPGGTFWMGAQPHDPSAPNYDPWADTREGPVHEVTLSPFFLSKFEMTQEQWQRFTGANPSMGAFPMHPVEQVSWNRCTQVLTRMGLLLPSEAQWEYGARAGTTTPWWTGAERDTLRGAVNLADLTATRYRKLWGDALEWPDLDDGFYNHAPVNQYRPNPFGLHSVHGNVWEWCQDVNDRVFYHRDVGIDPVSELRPGPVTKIERGGSYEFSAYAARSAYRLSDSPSEGDNTVGLRPARKIAGGIR